MGRRGERGEANERQKGGGAAGGRAEERMGAGMAAVGPWGG